MRESFWVATLAIVYTVLGYPLIVALWARVFPRRWRREPILPSVSLIVAAHNEVACIGRKLDNVQALDYPRDHLEVLVVDDGSTDETPTLAENRPGVRLIRQPSRSGKAAALNRGVMLARGEVLVFSDADVMLDSEALRVLVANFADPDVAVVAGARRVIGEAQLLGRAEAVYWAYEAWIRRSESLVGQTTAATGELMAVRRTDWRPLPSGTINDDFYLVIDALARGRRVVFEPGARAAGLSAGSPSDEVSRRRRIVAGRWQVLPALARLCDPPRPLVLWQVASHKLARALLPLFGLLAAVSNAALVLLPGRSSAPSWPQRAIFGGQIATGALMAARLLGVPLPGPIAKVASVTTYVLVNQYGQVLGFFAWTRGRQSALWTKAERRGEPNDSAGSG